MSKSKECFEKAKRLIPGGVNSPVRSFHHVGIDPLFFDRGEGAFLYDVDGNEYIDFCLSFGPHILGHSHPSVVLALQAQAAKATSFGASHPMEADLAEQILRAYPFLQKVRMVNSGTEAVMTAVRLARGATGRTKIVKFIGCYHGHYDSLLTKAGSGVAELSESDSLGVPPSLIEDTLTIPFEDVGALETVFEKYGSQIAAVLVEPIPANYGLWITNRSFLQKIFELSRRAGSLVVFDEVISGFRIGLGGAATYYDLAPDIVTLGKIIGGGLPLAAIVGRGEIMDKIAPLGGVYQAGTLSGNPLATAAGLAVVKTLFDWKDRQAKLDRLTAYFANELSSILQGIDAGVVHLNSVFWIHFGPKPTVFPPPISEESRASYRKLFASALQEGIYLAPSPFEVGFLSFAHDEGILDRALEGFRKCVRKV